MSTTTTLERLSPGQHLGPFEVVQLLKEGGQATVYLARIATSERPPVERLRRRLAWFGASPALVAREGLCVLKLAVPGKRESLIDEHAYLLQLRAVSIRTGAAPASLVQLFSSPELKTSDRQRGLDGIWNSPFVDAAGHALPFIALPYAPGGALDSLLRTRYPRPLPPAVAIEIVFQVIEALTFLHQQVDLVHHDLAPSNIVLREPLSPWFARPPACMLVDLAAADSPSHPRLRTIFGRSSYLPPQRLKHKLPISPAIDVYGLGVVLYELLGGALPQPSLDQATGLPRPLPPLNEQRPELSPELVELVMHTVSHDQRRWPSLAQFALSLKATPEARGNPALRGRLERPVLLVVLGSAFALVLVVLLLLFSLSPPLEPPLVATALPATITPQPTRTPTMTPTPLPPTSTPISQP
ncbi:MAG: serine/threonine-protein kinase [Oscillochloridaceae bacterium umkhey_bin13]